VRSFPAPSSSQTWLQGQGRMTGGPKRYARQEGARRVRSKLGSLLRDISSWHADRGTGKLAGDSCAIFSDPRQIRSRPPVALSNRKPVAPAQNLGAALPLLPLKCRGPPVPVEPATITGCLWRVSSIPQSARNRNLPLPRARSGRVRFFAQINDAQYQGKLFRASQVARLVADIQPVTASTGTPSPWQFHR